ncbi:hypothetical protein [Flaviflagellibacter deserti]|uniref:Secreted protein n=1 Tax=Flaviflagellibacter deserti TaxID=2267266 RepID=A0ABV9Z0R8_9HYPH
MQGFSLRAIFAADLMLFAFIALIFLGVVGSHTPQSASAEEGRAATSAPPPVDSLQGSSRVARFSTVTRGSEDHWNDDRDFDDSAKWPDRD